MSWREKLRPGKFRKARFEVEARSGGVTAGGRRLALHEYPLRDAPYAEDLGRKAREFSLECFVLGPDYMAARDALLAELEAPGPGLLVHPYLGTQSVAVRSYTLRESPQEGGLARLTLTFVEAGRAAEPAATVDTASAVGGAATAATSAAAADFAGTFSVEDRPAFISNAAIGIVQELNSDLRAIAGRIAAVTSPLTQFSAQLDQLGDNLSTLIHTPAALAASITGALSALEGVARDVASAFDAYRDLGAFGAGAPVVPTTTPTRQQQADNQSALHALVQRVATIEAARSSAQLDFASSANALTARDDLAERIDTLADTASDAVYAALADVRTAMVKDLTARGALLPRVSRYTPAATLPALVLAYRLHGDATRETEIIARNRVRHPGFVPGGVALEVLIDA